MSLSDAKYAMIEAVVSALGSIPTARENVPFVKPNNAKWAALYWMPNQPTGETLGDGGQDMYTGIVQVDIHYPSGSGDTAADADIETFRAAFKAGHAHVHNGQSIVAKTCGAPHRRKEDNWFIVSVTVGWYALVTR
jgi:hypothetical protein